MRSCLLASARQPIGIYVCIVCAYLQLLVSPWSHQIIEYEASTKNSIYANGLCPSLEEEEEVDRMVKEMLDRRRKQVGMCQM
jgi:hypothetical protein